MFRVSKNKTASLRWLILPTIIGIAISMSGLAQSEVNHADASSSGETKSLENTMCPVMTDEPVDREIFVDHKGKRIYLCCKMCRKDFLENPDPYLANLSQFTGSSPNLEALKETNIEEDHHGETTGEEHHDAMIAEENPQLPEKEHSHSDHGETSGDSRLIRFAGKFHPLVVHLPIGLILAAALAEGLFILLGAGLFKQAARFCVVLGALGAVSAAALGWASALSAHYPGDMARLLEIHRWLGISTALLALLTAIFSELFYLKKSVRYRRIYLIALILSVVLVALTGHFGAVLIYGPEHLTW